MSMSMTATQQIPAFPPCGTWCPGHKGDNDVADLDHGGQVQACSAPAIPILYGRNPDRYEYVAPSWGADTYLRGGRAVRGFSIRLEVEGEQHMTADDARELAGYLLKAADDMTAAIEASDVPRIERI